MALSDPSIGVGLCDRWTSQNFCQTANDDLSFGCQPYEVKNYKVKSTNCANPSAAQSANGYGKRCASEVVFATRAAGSTDNYLDAKECIATQVKGEQTLVVFPPLGCVW